MHRPAALVALASLATGSLAAVAGLKLDTRDSSGCLYSNVPLSSDPDHSSYTFVLDPSVKDVIANYTQTAGKTFNTIQVQQYCDVFSGKGGYASWNNGFATIGEFGQDAKYTVLTDKCENGESRSPLSYTLYLCIGDGTQCNTYDPWVVCGTPGITGGQRDFCAVTEPSGGNPKAVNLTDPALWSCQVCQTSTRSCSWPVLS
ncbi:hypothetical protein LX36DRAFT_664421 [Colletotrichum falcatum]|nr:hypothetical protein LX36DRAFT_664421 [Colletotrichum falcatum]